MPTTFTYLNELSASDGYYALDNTAPLITVTNIPANQISTSAILVYVSVFDEGGLGLSGITINGATTPISAFSTVGSYSTFNFNVTATGNIQISARDYAGNVSSLFSNGYKISATTPLDTIPPTIEFLTFSPTGKYISSDSLGVIHVRVTDNISIAASPNNFALLDGSVGTIGTLSAISPTIVEFDITVSTTGTVTLSARDDAENGTVASDGPWINSCDTGKKINLTNFLPSHLKESETFEFTQFFENFLNTMYEDKLKGCNYSILEKIDRLKNFKDADVIDADYFQYFANHFGYEVDINKGSVGEFSLNGSTDDIDAYIRCSLKNIPNFNRLKTCEDAIQVTLFSFGIVAELLYLWTNDYEHTWYQESRSDPINVIDEIPDATPPYYPTPHFRISVNYTRTLPTWTNNYDNIIKVFNNIKAINTVLSGLSGYFEVIAQSSSDVDALGYAIAVRLEGHIEVPWVGPIATYP